MRAFDRAFGREGLGEVLILPAYVRQIDRDAVASPLRVVALHAQRLTVWSVDASGDGAIVSVPFDEVIVVVDRQQAGWTLLEVFGERTEVAAWYPVRDRAVVHAFLDPLVRSFPAAASAPVPSARAGDAGSGDRPWSIEATGRSMRLVTRRTPVDRDGDIAVLPRMRIRGISAAGGVIEVDLDDWGRTSLVWLSGAAALAATLVEMSGQNATNQAALADPLAVARLSADGSRTIARKQMT